MKIIGKDVRLLAAASGYIQEETALYEAKGLKECHASWVLTLTCVSMPADWDSHHHEDPRVGCEAAHSSRRLQRDRGRPGHAVGPVKRLSRPPTGALPSLCSPNIPPVYVASSPDYLCQIWQMNCAWPGHTVCTINFFRDLNRLDTSNDAQLAASAVIRIHDSCDTSAAMWCNHLLL